MFELTKDGSEIIQKIDGKDSKGKWKKVKVADVVDNKVELVEGYKGAKSVDEETTPAKEEVKSQAQPEEVMTKDKFKEEAVKQVKKIIKEKAGKPELYTKEEEQIIENAKDSGVLQEATKELMEEVKQPKTYSGPLADVRQKAAEVDKELGLLLDGVKDMDVKQNIKTFFNKKLNEVKEDKAKVNKLIDRLEATIDNRTNRKYGENSKLLKAIVSQIDNLVKGMLKQLARLTQMVRGLNQKHKNLRDSLNDLMTEIEKVESAYKSTTTKTTIGTVSSIDEELYGVPVLEVNNTRVEAPKRVSEKTGKEVAQSTALNEAMELVKLDKLTELRDELYSLINEEVEVEAIVEDKKVKQIEIMSTNKSSLSNKLIRGLLINFPMNHAVHKIIKRTNDSVFGTLIGNPFKDVNKLLDVLPNSFKEFFITDKESRETLVENINTMAEYLDKTKVGKILLGENSLLKNMDNNGLAIKHINKYVPITREIVKGDKLVDVTKQTYIVEEVKGNSISVKTTGINSIKSTKPVSEFTGVLEQQEESVPVNILELIGTVKDGELQIDEQTKSILKFYSAKMLSDTNTMIGKILSYDETEMSKYLGITDPEEQLMVKQEAREGYVNAASIRKNISSEVYQALGIKFDYDVTPEFTSESFKSALGVLVQAIAIENGTIQTKPMKDKENETEPVKGNDNRNLIKVNWDSIGVDKDSLIKSVNKLQYMNENRNRPLPSLKEPADDNNRRVMNTQNSMDEKSTEFLNSQEKIAYTISPKLKRWLEMPEADTLKAMGYVDVKTANLHASEIDAQVARNDKLVREWEILKTFAKAVKDKKFYLKWGQTVSGRYTILNDINYQESKLHREFVVAEGSVETVDHKEADARQMLEASILQGLDMDPDKLSAKTASEDFNKLFKVTDKGIEVTPHKKDKDGNLDKIQVAIKQAYDAMKDGKFNAEAMAEVFADSEGHHGLSAIELLVDWNRAIKDNTKIETHANLEIDAITSGMILTLLQIGSNEAIALAEKGGIYTKKGKEDREKYVKEWLGNNVEFTPGALIEAGKKHAAKLEAELKAAQDAKNVAEVNRIRAELENDSVFKDLYSTIGVAMIGEVQAYKNTLESKVTKTMDEVKQLAMLNQIGELNLKNIRSIAKSPVMVYIYGATINSIKNKLTYSLGVGTLVKAMKTASKKLKAGEDVKEEIYFIGLFEPKDGWVYTDGLGKKIDKPAEEWKQLLHMDITAEVIDSIGKAIRATFGTAIENAFESRLGFVNRNRDAVKTVEILMFETYQIRLADEVKKLLDEKYGKKHKGEMYKLSREDIQNINNRLADQGYGHNIIWDEKEGRVNQSLNKTGDKGSIHSTRVQVGDVKVGGQIKQFKPAVNTGAAPTISIHAIDGRMMMDVLNRELDGKYTGGNVYDAVVLSLNKAMLNDTANTYNTNMIETGFSRSILADQLTALENMLSTMSDDQKIRMFKNIGLRPEGELRDDYTNEVNRLNLGIGKMLELLETSEEVNKERLANSANEYSVGHLFQMGAGVVDVNASEIRAKELPAIDTIKRLLENRQEQDRKITEKEFGVKSDYVFNTNDIIKGETQIKSKANIAQISTDKWVKTTDPMWGSLSSKDIVAIIGEYTLPEKADSKSRAYNKVIVGILKSNAGILDGKLDKKLLERSGRQLINGVWVKTAKEPTEVEAKPKNYTKETQEENAEVSSTFFKRDQDTYYTKEKTNYRKVFIPSEGVSKDKMKYKNILNSLFKAVRSDLSFGNGIKDIHDTFNKYPDIYTKEIKEFIEVKSGLDKGMREMKDMTEWENFAKQYIANENKLIELFNKEAEKHGLPKPIQADSVDSYEFGFSAQFLKDATKQEQDIILPSETFRKNVDKPC